MDPLATVGRSIRFVRGVRSFLRTPLDVEGVPALVADEHRRRDQRFLSSVDHLVWSVPASPWLRFFRHAGLERGDLAGLVTDVGLDDALLRLRDLGVYLSTEEAQGHRPVQRGSTTFTVRPEELFNPRTTADFIAGTSGTRSGGTPVAVSFASLRRMAVNLHATAVLWDVVDRPAALWRPALPGSGGVIALLSSSVAGRPPERWFSQLDPLDRGVHASKRLANTVLPVVGWPTRLPRPVHVATTEPATVLAWCIDALGRSDRAVLNAYPSSAVRLAGAAVEDGRSLDGLVVRLVGEPVSAAKASAVRASGAQAVNAYAFAQQGAVATACPHSADEELHVFEHEVAVVPRPRTRPDGMEVDAFLWTSLAPDARSVWINVENDDYGGLHRDTDACPCLLGSTGMRTRLTGVRGMSKAVTGGVTLPGSVVDDLVDTVLPTRFGGGPADWQVAEGDDGGSSFLEVRADPRVGPLADAEVVRVTLDALRATEAGVLAVAVWSAPGFIRVARRSPAAAPGGKTISFEPLAPARRPAR